MTDNYSDMHGQLGNNGHVYKEALRLEKEAAETISRTVMDASLGIGQNEFLNVAPLGISIQRDTEYSTGSAVYNAKIGNIERAALHLWHAVECEPSNTSLRIQLAEYLRHAGMLTEARRHFKILTEMLPDDVSLAERYLRTAAVEMIKLRERIGVDSAQNIHLGAALAFPFCEEIARTISIHAEVPNRLRYGLLVGEYMAPHPLWHQWRHALGAQILRCTGGTVCDGPFRGLALPHKEVDSAIALGCYEVQLHPTINRVLNTHYGAMHNIGCSIGYYAVGLARFGRIDHAIAWDLDQASLHACEVTAEANDIHTRFSFRGRAEPAQLAADLMAVGRSLLVVDIEGGEVELFKPEYISAFKRCDVIIELHEAIDPEMGDRFASLFQDTHDVEIIEHYQLAPENVPAATQFSPLEAWMAIYDARYKQRWMVAWAHSAV
ncbi:hypothetical protein [Azospirillum sp.]|uniref:hypothetical protein n=1 Tax=Azospirillum sp. TaxID=34012 RepID=UPI003D7593E4